MDFLRELAMILENQLDKETRKQIPWRKISTNRPLLVLLLAIFCNTWFSSVVMTTLPKFYNDAVGVELKKVSE